ncbi:short-chain dehydrogenase/reductase SDR, partial [Sphingomonas sp. LH128]|uniref:SDR family NAD(P)-dependent oxidoreductase n=1 Tax=Sphingomonas sp. LH128 TaxID=473781 RepID=UPI00027CA32D
MGRLDRLKGKVAIVTRAGQGIGAAIAQAYAANGASVVLTGRTYAKVAAIADGIRAGGGAALALEAHSGEREHAIATVERAIAEWGRIDV